MAIVSLYMGVIGLMIGSFLNVLIDRLPKGQTILWGRSHCDFCKKTLRWYELLPVISFSIQMGRCRRCHKRLSVQYPIIELVTAIGFAILFQTFFPNVLLLISSLIIFSSLLVITVADMKYQVIPDSMVVTSVIGTIIFLIAKYGVSLRLLPFVLSGVGSSFLFLFLWYITKRRGMGLGDVKFAFFMGLFLGFPQIIVALYAAFLTGAAVGVILLLRKEKTLKSKISFGPFLVFGVVVSILFGGKIMSFWRLFV